MREGVFDFHIVTQIIQLLSELRASSPQRTFSPSGDFVHCKDCRGKLTVV